MHVQILKKDLIEIRDFLRKNNQENLAQVVETALENEPSEAKKEATRNATIARQNVAKKRVENAVNLIRLEGGKVTPTRVANTAGVSYNTAKKYDYLWENLDK